jgi:hypothetical protein
MNREPIYAGLFALLAAVPGLRISSRILKHWNDVPAEQQPALYQAQKREQAINKTGEPTKWLLSVDLYVYVRTSGGQVPGTVLNPILDAIEAVFVLHPITGIHTLPIAGVEWARIEGAIETDEGTLGEQAVAIVPIQILAT